MLFELEDKGRGRDDFEVVRLFADFHKLLSIVLSNKLTK